MEKYDIENGKKNIYFSYFFLIFFIHIFPYFYTFYTYYIYMYIYTHIYFLTTENHTPPLVFFI